MTTIPTCHFLGQWFSLGIGQIYAVFPYMCINNLALARCMVRFSNDSAYASADYGHSYTNMLGFCLVFLPFVVCKNLRDKIKSCNISPGVPQIALPINVGAQGLIEASNRNGVTCISHTLCVSNQAF